MADHILDTNVLIVASAADPTSRFSDSDLPLHLQQQVFEWLAALRADETRRLVWDDAFNIYDEYRNKLTDQDYGLQVIRAKMISARFINIELDNDGIATVPNEFSSFDPSDRKFLAVLLADNHHSTMVNATDTDWLEIEAALENQGHTVEHLVEPWLRAKFAEKQSR